MQECISVPHLQFVVQYFSLFLYLSTQLPVYYFHSHPGYGNLGVGGGLGGGGLGAGGLGAGGYGGGEYM